MRFVEENNQQQQQIVAQEDGEIRSNELALRKSPAVMAIAQGLDVQNRNAVLTFGQQSASKISTFADRILSSQSLAKLQGSGDIMKKLAKIMNQIDPKELEPKKETLLAKIVSFGRDAANQILAKYQTIGKEIDGVHGEVVGYKKDILESNKSLDELFDENLDYYLEVEKYAVAAKMVVEEMERDDLPHFRQLAASGDQRAVMQLKDVEDTIELLRQRAYDLESAKTVSMLFAPNIRQQQNGNNKLLRRFESAFIVTIPAFKMGLIQAATARAQKNAQAGMDALDETTNKFLVQLAQTTADQSIVAARSGEEAPIKAMTVEQMWSAIKQGMDETEKIEQENAKSREEGMRKMQAVQSDFKNKMRQLQN